MVSVTEDDATVLFPLLSIAVKVMVVVPIGNEAGASLVTSTLPSTRSLAFAAARKAEIVESLSGSEVRLVIVIAAGTFRRGAVVSTTVTANEA